jgi:ABC-type bacteriocin/lantibiotic exporter with double-glycine peptidase domain
MTEPNHSTLPIASRRRSFAHLGPLLRRRIGWIALLTVAGLANAGAGLVGPWAIGRLVDRLPAGAGSEEVWFCAVAVAVAGIVMALGTWIGGWALAHIAMPVVAGLRTEVVDSALSLESQRIEVTGTGDLVSRVADDSRKISEAAAQVLPLVVESLLVVIVSAAGLAAIDWRLGIVGLVALPMYWLTLRWYLPRSEPIYREERAAFGRRAGRLLGGLTGAATLRAYRAEAGELHRIDAASGQARDLSIDVFRFVTRAFGRNNRAEAVVLSLLLVAGFALVWFGESTAGAVTTAALVFHRLFNPIGALVGLFDQIQSAGASLTRMVGVIDEAKAAPQRSTAPAPDRPSLVLENLWFSYEADPDSDNHVLRGVSLRIDPGEHIAVVGTTGGRQNDPGPDRGGTVRTGIRPRRARRLAGRLGGDGGADLGGRIRTAGATSPWSPRRSTPSPEPCARTWPCRNRVPTMLRSSPHWRRSEPDGRTRCRRGWTPGSGRAGLGCRRCRSRRSPWPGSSSPTRTSRSSMRRPPRRDRPGPMSSRLPRSRL